uniref:Erythrocyte membrane protein 1 n=1 Tax=Parastrongyloides trichosuri TaxID=131310 RepID=A0A0N4ZX32_PARTI
MLVVSNVLKNLFEKINDKNDNNKSLGKHFILEDPEKSYTHVNLYDNLNDCENLKNELSNNIINLSDNNYTDNEKNNKEEDETKSVDTTATTDTTNKFIDDEIWCKIKRKRTTSVYSKSSSKKSYLYKWQPKFLESSSSSERSTTTSSHSLSNNKKRCRKICTISREQLSNFSKEDLESLSSSSLHSTNIRRDVLEKLVTKYNLIYGDAFNIEDEYIDDTYDDEGCFTHLEFHIY